MTQGHSSNEFGLSADANPKNRGLVFGLPLGNFGLFASVLISFSAGFLAFFLTTFFGIFGILFYNSIGGHTADYARAYKDFALPVGIAVLLVCLLFFGFLWIRRKTSEDSPG
jgi:hypothetical protein